MCAVQDHVEPIRAVLSQRLTEIRGLRKSSSVTEIESTRDVAQILQIDFGTFSADVLKFENFSQISQKFHRNRAKS